MECKDIRLDRVQELRSYLEARLATETEPEKHPSIRCSASTLRETVETIQAWGEIHRPEKAGARGGMLPYFANVGIERSLTSQNIPYRQVALLIERLGNVLDTLKGCSNG